MTGAFEVSIVRSFGPAELVHSKTTGERWMNVCATAEERQAVVERIRTVFQEERGM